MENSKLIEILRTFSKEDIKSFGKFIDSPFFQTGRNVQSLFQKLKKYHPSFGKDILKKEKVFEAVYPGEKFNEKKITNAMFDLTKMSEEFLIQSALKKSHADKFRFLIKELKERKLNQHLLKKINEYELNIENGGISESYFLNKRYKEYFKAEYYFEQKNYDRILFHRSNFADNMFMMFLIDYIWLKRDLLIYQSVYNTAISNNPVFEALEKTLNIPELLSSLETKNFEYYHFLKIQYLVYKSVSEPDNETNYYELKELVFKHLNEFDHEGKYKLLGDLETYCTTKYDNKFSREHLEVTKLRLEKGLYAYSEHDYMSPAAYRNTMYACISLNELDWLEEFIDKHTYKLNPENRISMKLLAEANIFFARKNFDGALEKLAKMKYEFFLFKVDIKNLMLKIYYELDLTEQAYSLIDTYKHYLTKTNDISSDTKVSHNNFLRYYGELLNLKTKENIPDLTFLINRVTETNIIVSKNWLLEKYSLLLNSRLAHP